jgi:hypothetical protein
MNHPSLHRRKPRARLLVDPSEQISEFPGFFVLPRAEHHSPARRRREQFKEVMIGLLLLGGFIAGMAYFFVQFGLTWTPTSAKPAPLTLPSDVDNGGLQRR